MGIMCLGGASALDRMLMRAELPESRSGRGMWLTGRWQGSGKLERSPRYTAGAGTGAVTELVVPLLGDPYAATCVCQRCVSCRPTLAPDVTPDSEQTQAA